MSSVGFGLTQLGCARPNSVVLGLTRFCLAQLGCARSNLVVLGSAPLCSAQLSCARPNSVVLGPTRLCSAQLNCARLSSVVLGSAQLCSAQLGCALPNSVMLCPTWLGSAQLGWARLDSARLCSVVLGCILSPINSFTLSLCLSVCVFIHRCLLQITLLFYARYSRKFQGACGTFKVKEVQCKLRVYYSWFIDTTGLVHGETKSKVQSSILGRGAFLFSWSSQVPCTHM